MMNNKKIVSAILAVIMIVSVFASAYVAQGAETIILDFDSTANFKNAFSTELSTDSSIKTQGTGSLKLNCTDVRKHMDASGVGGYALYDFPTAQNLSSFDVFYLDVYFSSKMSGSNGIQINFISDKGIEDGFNILVGVDEYEAGWHTFAIAKNNPAFQHTNNAQWNNINRIRFLYVNFAKNVDSTVIRFDRLTGYFNSGYQTRTDGDKLILNDFDTLTGLQGEFNTVLSTDTAIKTQGSGSLNMYAGIPVGQASNIGAMAVLTYDKSADLSKYNYVFFDLYIPKRYENNSGLQVNFATSGSDGFNVMLGLDMMDVGWHTIKLTKAQIESSLAVAADLANINVVRFSWFNFGQYNDKNNFKFDNFYAANDEPSQSSEEPVPSSSDPEPSSETPSSDPEPSEHSTADDPDKTSVIPFVTGDKFMLHDFDSLNGISTEFNATAAVSTTREQGRGAVDLTATKPTGQASNIGAMMYVDMHNQINLSSFGAFNISVYNSVALSGSHQLQINFCTNRNGDGYNVVVGMDNWNVGWHTVSISSDTVRNGLVASTNADIYRIDRVRITWFNAAQIGSNVVLKFDNFYATGAASSNDVFIPYDVQGKDKMLLDGETLNGVKGEFNAGVALDSNQKVSGNSSIHVNATKPVGQTGNIGAMVFTYLSGGVNLKNYDSVKISIYNSMPMTGSHGMQVAFGTSVQDGYNYMLGMDGWEVGWHQVDIPIATILANKAVPYAYIEMITNIRFTWYNFAQQNNGVFFCIDDVKAYKAGEVVTHEAKVIDENTLMLHDFEDAIGVSTMNNTDVSLSEDFVKQGSKSLLVTPKQPVGQSSNICARVMIDFGNPVDFATDGYDNISINVHLSKPAGAGDKLDIYFISNLGQIKGYIMSVKLDGYEAGDYELTCARSSMMKGDLMGSWDNIREICVTWTNGSQQNVGQTMYIDNFRAVKSTTPSSSSAVDPSEDSSYEPPKPTVLYGDVNFDKAVDSIDSLNTLQCSVDLITFTEEQFVAGDVDGDGAVSSGDSLAILQKSVGLLEKFPVEEDVSSDSSSQSSEPPTPPSSDSSLIIPTTILENNAYTVDKTADTSFKITGEGLAQKTIYIIQPKVFNGGGSSKDPHYERYIFSLQGLINREFGMDANHTSIMYAFSEATDSKWLTYIMTDGVYKGFTRKTVNSWADFCTIFAAQMKQCGYVVWDGNVPATSNVAATVTGVDGYLPALSGSTLQSDLSARGITEKLNLVSKFTGSGTIWGTNIGSTGSRKNDAYRWAIAKYLDTNRSSAEYLGYIVDGSLVIPGNPYSQLEGSNRTCITNLDYLIARRAFCFDLDPCATEAACDDDGGKYGLDSQTMQMILQSRYNRANGEFGQVLGFPPWWVKYCSNTPGRPSGKTAAVQMEWLFSEYCAMYNVAKEADAADPANMTNGSAYYKYRAVSKEFKNLDKSVKESYNPGIKYYTIYAGDYDSSAWLKQYTINNFSDPKRGSVPIMWAFNPNLSWRVPMIFDYVYQKKKTNDYFTAGEGAGYLIPAGLFQGRTMSIAGTQRTNPNGDQKWIEHNRKFYNLFDIDITGFIINANNAYDATIFNCYNQFTSTGAFITGTSRYLYNGVPYIGMETSIEVNDTGEMYDYMFNIMNRYNCVAYRTICWSPTDIFNTVTNYSNYAASKGKTVKYVDPYTFFALAKSANQF